MILMRDSLPPAILADHEADWPPADLTQVSLAGLDYGSVGLFFRDGALAHQPGVSPRTLNQLVGAGAFWFGHLAALANFRADRMARRQAATPVIVAAFPIRIYGHVLIESVLRLIVLDRDCPREWPLLLPAALPPWMVAMLAEAAPGRARMTYDPEAEIVSAPRFVGMGDVIGQDRLCPGLAALVAGFKAGVAGRMDQAAASPAFAALMRDGALPQAIFVSRAGLGDRRRMVVGREALDAVAREEGLVIIHPEEMRFAEQVQVFDAARLVVGEYGSGLLNAVFCRPGAAVLALNRVDGYLSRIARSLDLDLGFLAPEGGEFVTDAALLRKPRRLGFAPEALRGAIRQVRAERAEAGRA